MGQRLLEVSADLITAILMPWQKPTRTFEVSSDPIPGDAKIVSIRQSQYRTDVVEIVLSSPSWSDEPPRTRISPRLQEVPTPIRGVGCSCGGKKVSCGTCGSLVIDCPDCGRTLQHP